MNPQQECPPLTVWQAFAAGQAPDTSGEHAKHLYLCRTCQSLVEELTGGTQTWLKVAAALRQPVPILPTVCQDVLQRLSQNSKCPPSRSATMAACIHVERMMHRNSIAVSGESAAGYTLVKLIPSGLGTGALGLNLVLTVDVSGSMYEEDGTGLSRLKRVQDAALAALQKMRPQDMLAIVGFAHNARLLLPPTSLADRERIADVIRRIDEFDVDPGGTAMDEGIALALSAVEPHAGMGNLSQLVILTDGETSGEQSCRALAREAAAKSIPLTLMGVGLDWKANLLKDLAHLSQGKWHYIDVQQAEETTRVFGEEFASLAASAFLATEMHLRPTKDVRIKRIRQVVPEIKELALEETAERTLFARLGTMQHDTPTRYILDLSLPRRPDGKYVVAQLEVTYDLGTGQRQSSGPVPLEMTYAATGHSHANAEVMKHIDDIVLKEMNDQLQIALQKNDPQAAQQMAREIVKKGQQMGPGAARKTMLAVQVMDELNTDGHVSRKTQLKLDDAARLGGDEAAVVDRRPISSGGLGLEESKRGGVMPVEYPLEEPTDGSRPILTE